MEYQVNKFRIVTLAATIVWVFLFISCERQEPFRLGGVDCEECYSNRPEWVRLNVEVTINDENPFVPLTILVGNYEEGQVDWTDTTFKTDYWVDVQPNRTYSVVAKYTDGANTVYAVDGDEIKLKFSETSCDVGCYYQVGGYIDVRLRP